MFLLQLLIKLGGLFRGPRSEAGVRPARCGVQRTRRNAAFWEALEQEIERGGWKVASKSDNKGFLKAYIIEAPDMGHYLEYIYPEVAGIAFFEGVPSS